MLAVVFDGGYVYNFKVKDQVDVGVVNGAAHAMRLRQESGTGLSAPVDVKGGARVQFWPQGQSPVKSRPGVPGYDPSKTPCNNDENSLPEYINNAFFIPDLEEAAQVMGTKVVSTPSFDGDRADRRGRAGDHSARWMRRAARG